MRCDYSVPDPAELGATANRQLQAGRRPAPIARPQDSGRVGIYQATLR